MRLSTALSSQKAGRGAGFSDITDGCNNSLHYSWRPLETTFQSCPEFGNFYIQSPSADNQNRQSADRSCLKTGQIDTTGKTAQTKTILLKALFERVLGEITKFLDRPQVDRFSIRFSQKPLPSGVTAIQSRQGRQNLAVGVSPRSRYKMSPKP